jgi:hypothetical protein
LAAITINATNEIPNDNAVSIGLSLANLNVMCERNGSHGVRLSRIAN